MTIKRSVGRLPGGTMSVALFCGACLNMIAPTIPHTSLLSTTGTK